MKNISYLILSLFTIIVFTSCEKENIAPKSDSVNRTEIDVNKDMNKINQFTKTLSIAASKNELILPALQEMALVSERKGHMDIEFFYHIVKDQPLLKDKNLTLKSVLLDSGLTIEEEEALCEIPGLAILSVENETSTHFLDRIYFDDHFDDSNPNSKIKFYERGILGEHVISQDPSGNTFVVRISEVYAASGSLNYKLHKSIPGAFKEIGVTSCGLPITIIGQKAIPADREFINDNRPHINCGQRSLCGETCARDCAVLTENLRTFQTSKDHDGRWRGKGEFFWLIIFGADVNYSLVNGALQITGNPLTYVSTGIYGGVAGNDTWYDPHYSSIIWDLTTDMNRMKYVNYESDGGSVKTITTTLTASLTVPVPGVGSVTQSRMSVIPFVVENGDDFVGETIVEYCHDLFHWHGGGVGLHGFPYNYGAVTMYINER